MSSTEGEDIMKKRLLDKADMKEPSEFSDWTSLGADTTDTSLQQSRRLVESVSSGLELPANYNILFA